MSSTAVQFACSGAITTGSRSTQAIPSSSCGGRPPTPHRSSTWSRSGRRGTAARRSSSRAPWPRPPGSVPVQLGGGVRAPEDVCELIEAGVERVVVGTAAFGSTPLREFVSDRVAVAIDVAEGIVRTNGWRESTELRTEDALERCAEAGVATVICTAIDRDGARSGPDLELLREVRACFAGSILAAGGIRDAADVARRA